MLLLTNLLSITLLLSSDADGAPTPSTNSRDARSQSESPIVDLGYARYEGTTLEADVNQWLGMSFAAPPLGDLRWRSPQDPVMNRTLQKADTFAPTCAGYWLQTTSKTPGPGLTTELSEDCLYLEVWTPSNVTTRSKLPVWFFIQGGGYAADSDENLNFTEVIQKSNMSMVAVQINYRVGAFGFLASEEIRTNGDLNVGLLDQRKALNWVQQYIHLFGGDPNHVVIHGDSAGAGSVAYQMTAYGGRDDHLFVGGMMESSFWPTHRKVSEMEFQYQEFAANVSCSPAEAPNGDTLACLRSKSHKELQASDVAQKWPSATGVAEWYFLPVVDGIFSPDYLYNLFEQGKVVPVPVLVGDDTDEGTGFTPNCSTSAQFLKFINDNYPKLTEADLQLINETYPKDIHAPFPMHADWFPAAESAYGEATFICPGIEVSTSLTTYNSPAEVWNYRYNVHDAPTIAAGLGVPHVSEKPTIWGVNNTGACDFPCSYDTYNAPIVPIVMDYWISFILSLNPNTYKNEAAPVWHTWQGATPTAGGDSAYQRLKIQTNATAMEGVPNAQLARCEIWKSLADVTEQ